MNEQQLADLFSEQIDQTLSGESFSLPAEAAEIQELLGLGQQVSQIQFQVTPAAQAAFYGQVASWFATGNGVPPAMLGLSKGLITGLAVATIVIGGGLGAVFLANFASVSKNDGTQSAPTQEFQGLPDAIDSNLNQPDDTATSSERTEDSIEKSSSVEDTIVPPKASSLGDELPSVPVPSLGNTLVLPTNVSTETLPATTENSGNVGTGIEEGNTTTDSNGDAVSRPEDDRGHGNDPGGYDPDNPGKSSGIPNKDSEPTLGRGEGDGSSGGSNSSGGKDNSNKNGNNENRGNGDK